MRSGAAAVKNAKLEKTKQSDLDTTASFQRNTSNLSPKKTRLLQRRREVLLQKGHNTTGCSKLVRERSKRKVVSQLADVKGWNLQAKMVQAKPWPYELGFIGGVPLLKNKFLFKIAKIKVKDVSTETSHRQSSPLHDSTNQQEFHNVHSLQNNLEAADYHRPCR